jgi:hypothetical protein
LSGQAADQDLIGQWASASWRPGEGPDPDTTRAGSALPIAGAIAFLSKTLQDTSLFAAIEEAGRGASNRSQGSS